MEVKQVLVQKRLCVKDSIIASIPYLFGIFIWIGLFILGMKGIEVFDMTTEFRSIAFILWQLIMLSLTNKLIGFPQTTWEVVEEEDA